MLKPQRVYNPVHMKKLIKYSKPSFAVIKNKSSFFNQNEDLLKRVRDVNRYYLKQKKRTRCKVCSNTIKDTHLIIHEVPYCLCSKCGHFNGLHEDSIEFVNYLYSADNGKNYASNYIKDYNNRVTDIVLPPVVVPLSKLELPES